MGERLFGGPFPSKFVGYADILFGNVFRAEK